MKFLADEGVDNTFVQLLRVAEYDVLYIAETERGTEDSAILAIANAENRILITRDKDFGELAWRMKMLHAGIILIRAEELNSISRSRLVSDFIETNQEFLYDHFIVIQPGSARIRKLNHP